MSNQRSSLYQQQSPRQPSRVQLQLLLACLVLCWSATHAFVPSTTTTTSSFRHDYQQQQSAQQRGTRKQQRAPFALFATLPDVATMSVADMRAELDGYGISSKAFLEKRELIDAVEKARAEGKTTTKKTEASSSSSSSGGGRQEKLDAYLEKANKMKASELLKALKEMGVNTNSFFEKRELVQAYVEAMVDGSGQSNKKQQQNTNGAEQERHDPSYRDVAMKKFDARDPNLGGSRIIDVNAN